MPTIWIIDDERAICWALKKAFENDGHTVNIFSNAEEALIHLKANTSIDAIMLDMRLPGMDGFEAARAIQQKSPDIPIVMMTAFGDLSTAVQAMQLNVFEYLTKPFDLSDAMRSVVMAIASRQSKRQSHSHVAERLDDHVLLGNSHAMQSVYKRIAIAARSDVSVLIFGASGTGKESVAAAIHRNSTRNQLPFVPIAADAYNPATIESELLGTQQSDDRSGNLRSGIFELAGEGTLYIDEVSDLPLSIQSQLLRILEHKQFSVIGSPEPKPCRARVIASSSRSVDQAILEGELRSDLAQRLGVFTIELTPLAKRREDILPIANAILAKRSQGRTLTFAPEAIDWLQHREWSGNVRELRNAIEHAIALSRGDVIFVEHFPKDRAESPVPQPSSLATSLDSHIHQWVSEQQTQLKAFHRDSHQHSIDSTEVFGTIYDDYLAAVEPPLLRAILESCDGNRAAAALQLGLHRSTLRQKMKRYHIE